MTFSSERDAVASQRFSLVRLKPARCLDATLVSVGGGVYQATYAGLIFTAVERNGTALTKVTTVSGNDQWSFDETTGIMQVQIASAPNDTTNVVVGYYELYYSSGGTQYTYATPTDSATTLREWQPRLRDDPTVAQAASSQLAGVFTISASSITILDTDRAFRNYLGSDDSFYRKEVQIWFAINGVANVQLVFKGCASRIDTHGDEVTVSLRDEFEKLYAPALMGDTLDEAYFLRKGTSFPSLDPAKQDRPVPLIFGKSSRFGLRSSDVGSSPSFFEVDPSNAYEAACTSFSSDVATNTNNRAWGLCRFPAGVTLRLPVFSGFTSASDGGSFVNITYTNANFANADIQYGDRASVFMTNGTTSATRYGHVTGITVAGGNTTVLLSCTNSSSLVSSPTTTTVTPYDAPALVLQRFDGVCLYPRYPTDYTYTIATTSGGNQYLSITFLTSLESGYGATPSAPTDQWTGFFRSAVNFPYLDPARCKLFFRANFALSSSMTHASVLKSLCTNAGMTVNAATFTAADAALTANCRFSIPNYDEQSYRTYLEYAQDLLWSTLGILYLNSSMAAEYALLSAPSPTTALDQTTYLKGSLATTVSYDGIVNQLSAFNPHLIDSPTVDSVSTPVFSQTDYKAYYLNKIWLGKRFRHVLDNITARIAAVASLRSRRAASYTFQSATKYIDAAIWDSLTLTSDEVAGGSGSVPLRITGFQKTPTSTTVVASDLLGL